MFSPLKTNIQTTLHVKKRNVASNSERHYVCVSFSLMTMQYDYRNTQIILRKNTISQGEMTET